MRSLLSLTVLGSLLVSLASFGTTVLAPGETRQIGGEQVVCSLAGSARACSVGPSVVCTGIWQRYDPGCSVTCGNNEMAKCSRAYCGDGAVASPSSCTCEAGRVN